MAESLPAIFHGNPTLADNQTIVPASFKESWMRDLKAIFGIIKARGKTEAIAAAASALPPNDPLRIFLTKVMVNTLYSSLLHPPLSYKGPRFQYRAADGGDNNFVIPELGKAGLPYAKSVPTVCVKAGAKPDPGVLFDMLMARTDDRVIKESDLGISSLLLYHADLIIHDIFRTNSSDSNISDTSSYLDLTPLYGRDRAHQEAVRQMKFGLLKPDSFAEDRLLNQPLGVCIYIICYNRFHNYVAKQLLAINENGKFTQHRERPANWKPTQWLQDKLRAESKDPADLKTAWERHLEIKLDEDLFQTARLITCGLYINISVHDYLRVLMRKHAELTSWTLEPRSDIDLLGKKGAVQRGIGNQVSVEFNVLYRFHSPLSKRDALWTQSFLQRGIDLTEPKYGPYNLSDDQIKHADFPLDVMRKMLLGLKELTSVSSNEARKALDYTPKSLWLFDEKEPWYVSKKAWELKRDDKTGYFNDEDLVTELVKVMQDPICQFGAQNVPKFFRTIEILGILQSRKWELATLNEFRAFFGMSRHKTFEDINSSETISNNLRNLYGDVDAVELYPGLFCEGEGRCLDPGSSCPGGQSTALWRGVFSDAVTLVRSDRFYTVDYNVEGLTAWGMSEVSPDREVFKGGVMGRLFQRAFPGFFPDNAVYLWQPFYTAAMNTIVAHDQGILKTLQPVTDLNVKQEEFDRIMKLQYPVSALYQPVGEFLKRRNLSLPTQEDVDDCEDTRKELNKTYAAVSLFTKLFSSRGSDADRMLRKIRFKLLRDKVKMTVVKPTTPPIGVSNLSTLAKDILNPSKETFFKNPGYADDRAIPAGPLRDILTRKGKTNGQNTHDRGMKVLEDVAKRLDGRPFLDYFQRMSDAISDREALNYKDYQRGSLKDVKQLDVIYDFCIPVVTRFAADFLGISDVVKTQYKSSWGRKFDENQLFQHFQNCTDYTTFDQDETRTYRRRQAFRTSIVILNKLALQGVKKARKGWFEFGRSYIDYADSPVVQKAAARVRELGVTVARALTKELASEEQAAAMMLAITLDALNKSVVTFTESLRILLSTNSRKYWSEVQALAFKNTEEANATLIRYVLEAQRISVNIPQLREFVGGNNAPTKIKLDSKSEHTLKKGDIFLLEIQKALKDSSVWDDPNKIILNRTGVNYLQYQPIAEGKFNAKQLNIIATTGMVKFLAKQQYLREAPDQLGEIQTARVPQPLPGQSRGVEDKYRVRYLNAKWSELGSCPSTWSLRFNVDPNAKPPFVAPPAPETSHSHAIDRLWGQEDELSYYGGTLEPISKSTPGNKTTAPVERTEPAPVNGNVNGGGYGHHDHHHYHHHDHQEKPKGDAGYGLGKGAVW